MDFLFKLASLILFIVVATWFTIVAISSHSAKVEGLHLPAAKQQLK